MVEVLAAVEIITIIVVDEGLLSTIHLENKGREPFVLEDGEGF